MAENDGGVQVQGSGVVYVTPDVVMADLGAEARSEVLTDALEAANTSLARLRDALVARGVAEKDLRTTQTSIWHQQRTDDRGNELAPIVQVTLGLRATLRDIAGSGAVISAALAAAGQNARMNGMSFDVSDKSAATEQARAAAFEDARRTAQQYATLAGRELGRVVAVSDTPGGLAVREAGGAMMSRAVSFKADMGVDAGEQSVRADVSVAWAWA